MEVISKEQEVFNKIVSKSMILGILEYELLKEGEFKNTYDSAIKFLEMIRNTGYEYLAMNPNGFIKSFKTIPLKNDKGNWRAKDLEMEATIVPTFGIKEIEGYHKKDSSFFKVNDLILDYVILRGNIVESSVNDEEFTLVNDLIDHILEDHKGNYVRQKGTSNNSEKWFPYLTFPIDEKPIESLVEEVLEGFHGKDTEVMRKKLGKRAVEVEHFLMDRDGMFDEESEEPQCTCSMCSRDITVEYYQGEYMGEDVEFEEEECNCISCKARRGELSNPNSTWEILNDIFSTGDPIETLMSANSSGLSSGFIIDMSDIYEDIFSELTDYVDKKINELTIDQKEERMDRWQMELEEARDRRMQEIQSNIQREKNLGPVGRFINNLKKKRRKKQADKLIGKIISVSSFMTKEVEVSINNSDSDSVLEENSNVYKMMRQLDQIIEDYKHERASLIKDINKIYMYVDIDGIVSFSSKPFKRYDDEDYIADETAELKDLHYAKIKHLDKKENLVFFNGYTSI